MAFALTCSVCQKQLMLTPDGRMPPWCPHCGASVKPEPEAKPPASPSPVPAAPPVTPAQVAPMPLGSAGFVPGTQAAPTESFFHACVPAFSENDHKLYRVYVTASDLLVFALGVGAVSMGEVLARTRSTHGTQPGLAGAMAAWQEGEQLRLARRIAELDVADAMTLRQYAMAGDRAFAVALTDVSAMSLRGPSLWYRWICGVQHEAVWKFAHRTQGRWSLALPSVGDARRAAEWLPKLFPGIVAISLSWGARRS